MFEVFLETLEPVLIGSTCLSWLLRLLVAAAANCCFGKLNVSAVAATVCRCC